MEQTLKQTVAYLKTVNKVAILCHQSPDGDTLGCGFALWHALRQMGKQGKVFCSDPIGNKFSHLFTSYTEEAFTPETVICVDVADRKLLGNLSEQFPIVHFNIDHHPSNTFFAQKTYLEADAGSACEAMYRIFTEMDLVFTKEMANCLFTGLITDTGCFRFSSTRPFAHIMAADLMEKGADSTYLCRHFFGTKSKALLRLEALVMDTLTYHFKEKVALISVTTDMLKQSGATQDDYDVIASIPAQIEGVKIGITIKQREKNLFKLSVRTHDEYMANDICKRLGGGGHFRAAGCSIEGDLEKAKATILAVVENYIKEIDK